MMRSGLALTGRALATCVRLPSLTVSPLMMSVFFLVIYEGQFSALSPVLTPGARYVDTVLPLFLLTLAFTGGAVSGQLIVRDLESGYYARIALTPISRGVAIGAPLVAGAIVLTVEAIGLIGVAYLLGLRPDRGLISTGALVGATVAIGAGFLLLAAAAAVWAGSASAVSSVMLIFFPLSFLTAALVPRDRLGGWMAVAADLNPLTYLLEGLRTLLAPVWWSGDLARAGVASAVLLVAGTLAVRLAIARRGRTGV